MPPSESQGVPAVREVVSRLGRLRARIRSVFAFLGVARWIVGAVALLALFFLADRFLDLPYGVRRFVRLGLLDRPDGLDVPLWIFLLLATGALAVLTTRAGRGAAPLFAFLAAGLGGVLAWLAARLFLPLRVPLADQDLALSVERRFRHLNDRLAAALDFEKEIENPTRGESVPMMRAVVAEAVKEAEGLEFARVVSSRRAARWGGLAAAALAVAGLAFVAMPETLSLFLRRSLLAERGVAWPRSTTVVAVEIAPGGKETPKDPSVPYRASVGRTLAIHARVSGDVPSQVHLYNQASSGGEGGKPMRRRLFPVGEDPRHFVIELRDLRRPFSFVLKAGDDDDDEPLYRVEVTVPPQVLDLRASLEFPTYLGRPSETVEGGNLEVPAGTRVTATFGLNVQASSVAAVVGDRTIEAAPVAATPGRWGFSFEPESSTRYRIAVTAKDGRENDPERDTYEVRVEPDRPPRVEWVFPRGPVEVTPEGRVPLLVRTIDDHGVTGLVLEVRLSDAETFSFPLEPRGATSPTSRPEPPEGREEPGAAPRPAAVALAANDGPYGRATVRTYVPLEIASLRDAKGAPLTVPARLTMRVVAMDSKGQGKEGPWTAVDVYRAAEMERTLAGRRGSVRTDFAAVLADQVERRRQTAEVAKGPIGEAERDLLKTIQFGQAKIAQDAQRAARGLVSLFGDFVYDRLGNPNPNEKILGLFDAWHARTYGEADARAGGADATSEDLDAAGDPVFPWALYDEVLRGWREKSIFDTAVLDRMLAVLSDGVDVAARHAPAAHRASGAAASSARPADVEALVAAQDALIASLQRLLDAMRSWQSLNDVVLRWRSLVERQTGLNARLDKPAEPRDR